MPSEAETNQNTAKRGADDFNNWMLTMMNRKVLGLPPSWEELDNECQRLKAAHGLDKSWVEEVEDRVIYNAEKGECRCYVPISPVLVPFTQVIYGVVKGDPSAVQRIIEA